MGIAISIVVPVYNVENYLNTCVDSLLNQNFDEYEILLIDDGSTDSSPEICDDYSAKYDIVKCYHKENGGLSSARNYGIERAKGEWIIFVDSDDYWLSKDVLQTLLQVAKDNSADFVRFEYTAVDENGRYLYEHCYDKKSNILDKRLSQYEMFHHGVAGEFFAWLYMARKELYEYERLDENRKYQEDIDFCIRLFATKKFSCAYTKERFYAYRKRRNSITSTPIISNLEGSFTLTDVFYNYSLNLCDKQLQREYQYYSVMMYYWTLYTFVEAPYFENRRSILRILNVNSLRHIAMRRMICNRIFNTSSIFIILTPRISVLLLYARTRFHNIIKSIIKP